MEKQNHSIVGAKCDYSARGSRREHWYRMVWTGSTWDYVSSERLVRVGQLASTRHQSVRGKVQTGDVVCQHDHGGQVDRVFVVVDDPTDEKQPYMFEDLPFRARNGKLFISMPFEAAEIEMPNPRSR